MGAEARCRARFNGRSTEGRARLETDVLQFRAPGLKVDVPFKSVKDVAAKNGSLSITFDGGVATLALGEAAPMWAEKIRNPPSRLDKIGARPDWRASAIGVDDEVFLDELQGRVATLTIGRTAAGSDAIFLGAASEADLAKIARLKTALKANGALWVIRPKGRPDVSEAAVMRAGRAAGLVDVKVVRFSATHTAEKFVIPIASRPRRSG